MTPAPEARQPLPRPDPHHLHPAGGASLVRHPRELRADGPGDRDSHRRGAGPRPHHLGNWPHLASAYITGISVGILIRSPFLWPYFLCSLISIASKYVLRLARHAPLEPVELRRQRGAVPGARHGVAPEHPVGQRGLADGRHLGAGLGDRLARGPVPHLGHLRRVVPALLGRPQRGDRHSLAGQRRADHRARCISSSSSSWSPTRRRRCGPKWAQCVVVFIVAFVEMLLRLAEVVYAPFYALFLVGPAALIVEAALDYRRQAAAPATLPAGA